MLGQFRFAENVDAIGAAFRTQRIATEKWRKGDDDRMDNYVITIARGYGSGGKQIALKLAEHLGIECYEHRILTLASEYSNIDGEKLLENDERLEGSLLQNRLQRVASELGLHPITKKFTSRQEIYDIQKKMIEKLADEQSCIIVGKCADYILEGRANVVRLYIEAPREFCRGRIMRRQSVSAEKADQLITSTDRYRADYYKFYTGGKEWTNPTNYDLVINSSRMSFEEIVELISSMLRIRGLLPKED